MSDFSFCPRICNLCDSKGGPCLHGGHACHRINGLCPHKRIMLNHFSDYRRCQDCGCTWAPGDPYAPPPYGKGEGQLP